MLQPMARERWSQVTIYAKPRVVACVCLTIADEVDSQLKQAMLSYAEPTTPSWSAA